MPRQVRSFCHSLEDQEIAPALPIRSVAGDENHRRQTKRLAFTNTDQSNSVGADHKFVFYKSALSPLSHSSSFLLAKQPHPHTKHHHHHHLLLLWHSVAAFKATFHLGTASSFSFYIPLRFSDIKLLMARSVRRPIAIRCAVFLPARNKNRWRTTCR